MQLRDATTEENSGGLNYDKQKGLIEMQPPIKKKEKVASLDNQDATKIRDFSERLRLLIGNQSARSFAASLNLSSSGLHQYLKGKSDPSRAVLSLIANKTGASLEWLVDGNGPMLKSDSLSAPGELQSFTITNLEGQQIEYKPSSDLCHIPVLSMAEACGKGTLIEGERTSAVFSATRLWFVRELGRNQKNLCLVQAKGDSMADTIRPDELVFVDRSCKNNFVDGIWVFSYDGLIQIKRLEFFPRKKAVVRSDNPRYEGFIIELDESFRLLGRVIAALPLRRL